MTSQSRTTRHNLLPPEVWARAVVNDVAALQKDILNDPEGLLHAIRQGLEAINKRPEDLFLDKLSPEEAQERLEYMASGAALRCANEICAQLKGTDQPEFLGERLVQTLVAGGLPEAIPENLTPNTLADLGQKLQQAIKNQPEWSLNPKL